MYRDLPTVLPLSLLAGTYEWDGGETGRKNCMAVTRSTLDVL